MGVASGCGCKDVYRFPHITYPYSSCIYLFFFPYFLFIFLNVFRYGILYIYREDFAQQYGEYGARSGSPQ